MEAEPTPRSGSVRDAEVAKFERLAAEWWDPTGPMRPLHRLNPVRLAYVRDGACAHFGRDFRAARPLAGLRALDIGCGAGLVCEPLARLGADIVGVDPGAANIAAARLHAGQAGLRIDYRAGTVENLAAEGESFDLVLCLEVVEHVADPPAFVAAVARTVRPGGLLVISTINRTAKAYALVIVGAEYVLRWLPRGTHSYEDFVTPAELGKAVTEAGLSVTHTSGVRYDPLRDRWLLADDLDVNYMMTAAKPA